ncbi:hypothetical protein H4R20_001039 [Coemansia guatemalensis]|uniref:Uncharacterized protein n=1 Tax=Coemansia guatemalensis TaxID=2761395 RepID=A0A9W8LVA2_9FUNG|nr:hypothetical protein H4R20_001039 [Coemansia guatemalensis]
MLRLAATRKFKPVVSAARLIQAQPAARRFVSSNSHGNGAHDNEHHDEKQPEFEEEGFNSPLWKYSIGAIGVLYLISVYDDYIERSGRVHPLTMFYASIMTDKVKNRQIFSEYQQEVARVAEYNILAWEDDLIDAESAPIEVPYFRQTAKWGKPVGSNVSVDVPEGKSRTAVKE